MRQVFVNDMRRLWAAKHMLILLVLLTAVSTAAAVYMGKGLALSWDVATLNGTPEGAADSVRFVEVDQAPGLAQLASGRYDAVLTMQPDGSYTLESIKGEQAVGELARALEGGQGEGAFFSGRGIGTNILGFLTTFILLMGSMAMFVYADDKQQGQLGRVAASPIHLGGYLLAHCVFNFCFLFLPTLPIVAVGWIVSGAELGFGSLVLLMALLCAFATAFSLLLYSIVPNKAEAAKMVGNTIIILTSILAGGFYAFDAGNPALGRVIAALPQKAFLTVADGMEQGSGYRMALVYLLAVLVVFYGVSAVKLKRDYVKR